MNSRFREEERMRLIALIQEWNLSRIDLFSLSEPNQNLEFFGVMRFYYQDEGEKVSTKCIRVSSTASASDVIEILVEKFRPDMRMLTRAEYSLYEVHINGDERRLLDHERPLLIQLNWGKDDREGRFLLKKEVERSSSSLGRLSASTSELSTATSNGTFKRKLSKKEKKELKKKEKEDKIKQLANRGSENEGGVASDQKGAGVAEKLYSELPESSFTRSISNPELVMRKRRQLKLERKFQDMNSPDGAKGGTLKIYGQSIKPDIPYKTLLVSANDSVAQIVCEALEKYGYENEDPDHFCLVMVMVPPDGNENNNREVRERVMDDDEYPLSILQQHPPSKGLIKFHLRLRPPDAPIRRRQDNRINKSMDSNYSLDSWSNNNNNSNDSQQQQQMSYLVPIAADGREITNSERIIVPYGMLEVGRGRTHPSNLPFFCLTAPDILPQHCSLTRSAGGATWITPANHEAATVFVQNQRVREPTQINNGQVLQIGKSYFFRYLDSRVPSTIQNSNYVTIGNVNKYNNNNNHLRSPSSSSGSTTRPGKDFETTFDLDGQVLTVPSHGPIGNKNSNNNNEALVDDVCNKNAYNTSAIHQQQFKSNNLLPANFILPEGHEDAFLRECIAEVNFAAMQFKMSPSFLVYLSVRSMLRSSSSSSPDVEQRINNFSARMSQLINKSVKENMGNPPLLSFWLANASELKNFFSFDRQLSRSTEQAQHTLMDVVQAAFSCFGDCLKGELEQTLPAIIGAGPEAGEMEVVEDFVIKRLPPKLGNVTHVLTLAMSVLRRCRVNTTITIFIFSQLFQFIGSWVFNCVVLDQRLRLCSSDWGRRLRLRLQQIMMWSEKQGLEKAAECHLAKAMQLCLLLECRKSDLLQILPKLDLINSVQLHAILSNFIYTQDDPPPPREIMDRSIRMVASTVDYDVVAERGEPGLPEPLDLHLPVARVFPKDGFSCDSVVGVPQGMLEFVEGFSRMGIGAFSLNPNSSGSWNVYLDGNVQATQVEEVPPKIQEVIQVTLHKVRNSLGLSIVAAQGEGQRDKGIYIKSVVPSGAADLDGRIEIGDQLIEVGGRSLIGVTQEKAAEMMSQSGQVVNLKVLKKAASHHGLAALLTSDPSRQKKSSTLSSNNQSSRTKVQNPDSDLSLSSSTVTRQAFIPDNDRSQSSLSWKPDESVMPKEGPYGRLPLNPAQPARIPFSHGMQSSHSDPNLINPDDSYLRVRPKISGPKKFEDGVSSSETFSESKHGVKNVADQLRSSSLAQGLPYQLPSPLTEVYQAKQAAYGNPNQNIPNHPATNGRQDPLYGKFGRSDSPMGSVQFSDAPPIKFNPALPASKPPRPTSAMIPLSKGPGYATQMLFPKATPQSQQQPNVRVSPAIFSQNAFNPPSSQNQNYSTIPSNTDFLIDSANQSSEIYLSRSQIQPKLNTSSDYDFPPPPPDVQLAQLKISSSASIVPRPFETIQSDAYESSHLTKAKQNEMNLPLVESSTNQKKPPPVATKPKITPADLKSVTLSKSPWEKEAREKEEEEMMKRKRKDEMRRLENRPYLSQEEQIKLKKLQTEEEFDQRAMQASQENQDVDTPIRTFPPNIGYTEQSSNLFMSERQQNQNYGPSRTSQAPFEQPSRQPPVNYNPIGYGQQEEQPIMLQYDPYRSREELQMATRFPPSKQFDNISQSSLNTTLTGGMKKTVTFNENVGVNEYPVLRSYGSTSSDGSLVQSFDQSFSGNYSDDHSPNSTFQRSISSQPVFLPKLDQERNMYANNNQVSYEYKPKFTPEPLYAPRPPNPSLSYPYRPPPLQSNLATQPRQAPPMVYPYRPPAAVVNAQRPITNPPVQGRRVLDPTYVQRTALQENPYSRNKSYGNYSHE